MLIYLVTRIISSTVAFLYPGYASYKTLSQRPASEADLERWLMYWSVLGCIVGVEYVAEWVICWIPLYYPLKTIFLLYLVLPQTQGASYLYKYHLQPFFNSHESDIDATLLRYKTFAYRYIQDQLRTLWEYILSSMGQTATATANAGAVPGEHEGANPDVATPPTLGDPISGPMRMLGGLWRTYGPTLVASGAAALQQTAQASRGAAAGGASFFDFAAAAVRPPTTSDNRTSVHRQTGDDVPRTPSSSESSPTKTIPVQRGSSAYLPLSRSEADLRARISQFEEVEVPSDIEGYDAIMTPPQTGGSRSRPDVNRRTSWFGWGGGTPDPTERAKKDE